MYLCYSYVPEKKCMLSVVAHLLVWCGFYFLFTMCLFSEGPLQVAFLFVCLLG